MGHPFYCFIEICKLNHWFIFYNRIFLFWTNKMWLSFPRLFSRCVLAFRHQQLICQVYCNCLVTVKFIPRYIVTFSSLDFTDYCLVFLNLCICWLGANLICFRCLLRMRTGFSKMNCPTLWNLYQKSLWIVVTRCFTYCFSGPLLVTHLNLMNF